jgi:heterodisulfide reductase subunit A2
MESQVIVVGGGVAGLSCSLELARLGFQSTLVEKQPALGGQVATFACKATTGCRRCGACSLEDLLASVRDNPCITVMERTSLGQVSRNGSPFTVELQQRPHRIFPDKCTNCNACVDVCPVPGALTRPGRGDQLFVNEDVCLYFTEGSCRVCVEACPEAAISFDSLAQSIGVTAQAVVLATGFTPYDAADKPRFGCGFVPGVVSALDLEKLLRDDNWAPAQEGRPNSVAFIQCVGSRDPRIGRNYCSRVCCGYALRMARLMKTKAPELEPTMFYMDIQTFDRDFERRLGEAAKEVRLIRSIPAEVRLGDHGGPEVVYHGPDEERVTEQFGLVVLSVGISPHAPEEFAFAGTNGDGFLGTDGESVLTETEGVFVAGTAQSPRSIVDSISHAITCAGTVAGYVRAQGNS